MCFGGSSDGGSKEMVKMQKDEAAEARQKEVDRQARINDGLARIKAAFEGSPVKATRSVYRPESTTTESVAVPGGTKRVLKSNERTGRQQFVNVSTPGSTKQVSKTTPGGYFDEEYDTGQTSGGIGDDFFGKFRQSMIDYYSPQVAKQYEDAKKELTYRLARAGTLRSSVASEKTADLAEDKKLRDAEVLSKADSSTGDLRTRVAGERAKAESQLYATENPDVAANQALASIRDITAEEPTLTPLGELFNVASIGGANFLKGAANSRYEDDLRKLTRGYSTEIG